MTTKRTRGKHAYRGAWIALFGPDGVGKSAVIEQVAAQLGSAFHDISQFHFRPHFGRQAGDRQPVTDPHGRPPRGLLISIVKLIYWLLDCWYGYMLIVYARRRSRLVISDRYFPDILVDPRRYRLPASSARVAQWLCLWAPRPDLGILLDAPAEIVQQRKAEVSLAESERQRRAYLSLSELMPITQVVDANRPVQKLTQEVCAAILASALHPPPQRPDVLINADF